MSEEYDDEVYEYYADETYEDTYCDGYDDGYEDGLDMNMDHFVEMEEAGYDGMDDVQDELDADLNSHGNHHGSDNHMTHAALGAGLGYAVAKFLGGNKRQYVRQDKRQSPNGQQRSGYSRQEAEQMPVNTDVANTATCLFIVLFILFCMVCC